MKSEVGGTKLTFQQDSAPTHKAQKTQALLKANNMDFWDPQTWPSNSPDMNPLNYFFQGELERKVCATSYNSINSLKASIQKHWSSVSPMDVVNACKSFRPHLEHMMECMEVGTLNKICSLMKKSHI